MSANGQANGNGQSILEKRRVSIIGMGRLGLCMALQLERAGWDVLGCDVIAEYVASINARTVASNEPGVQEWLRKAKRLRATTSMEMTVDFSDLEGLPCPIAKAVDDNDPGFLCAAATATYRHSPDLVQHEGIVEIHTKIPK